MREVTESFETWPPRLEEVEGAVQDTSISLLGSASARCEEAGDRVSHQLAGAVDRTYYLRAGIRVSENEPASNMMLLQAFSGSTGTLLQVALATWGELRLWNNFAAKTIDESGVELAAGTFYQLELAIHIPVAGEGTAAYRIHGASGELIYESGDIVTDLGNAAIDYLTAGRISDGSGSVWVDEFAVNDDTGEASNSWPGPALPPTSTCLWGALMSGDHYNPVWDKAPYQVETWDTFEANAGRRVGIVHAGDPWLTWDGFGAGATDVVRSRFAQPLKSLGASGSKDPLGEVLAGEHDAEIDAWAQEAKAYGGVIYLRPWWEMNGTWFPWGRHESYVAAWKYLHGRIKAIAPNVQFVWCTNTIWEDPESDPAPWYPGDAYVDWVGIDGYTGRNPAKDLGWFSANTLFVPTYERLREIAPSKPVMICEVGASEYGPEGKIDGSKTLWLIELLRTTIPHNMPEVRALVYFNWEIEEGEGKLDWPIESSEAAQAAFAAEIASDYYYAPAPPLTPAARVLSEPVDDTLFVTTTGANGRPTRYSGIESDAGNIAMGIKSSSSAPGGHRDSSFTLLRDPRRSYSDADLIDEVVISGRTKPLGRNVFQGMVAETPSELGDGYSIAVNAVGHQELLNEDENWRELYVQLGAEGWDEAPLARRRFNAGIPWSQGKIPLSNSEGLSWDPPSESLNALEVTEAIARAPAGTKIAKVGYRGIQKGAWSNFEPPMVIGSDEEASFAGYETVAQTLDGSPRVASFATPRTFAMLRALVTTGHTPAAGVQRSFDRLARYGDHGLTLRDIAGELPGVYGHDVLAHMFSQAAPDLQYSVAADGTIVPNTSFVLPDFAPTDGGPAKESVERLNAYFLNFWGVWDEKKAYWHPWDPTNLTWDVAIAGGAHWTPVARQAFTLLNGVVVYYTDYAGVSRTAGPPGSGCDYESPLLQDPDPNNPYTRRGRRRWGKLQVDFPLAYPTTAFQVGSVVLAESRMPQRSGTLVVRPLGPGHIPHICHPTMGPVPIWAVRSGDFAQLNDWPEPEPFRIIETDYDHDSKTLTAQLDSGAARVSAMLERVGIRMTGII